MKWYILLSKIPRPETLGEWLWFSIGSILATLIAILVGLYDFIEPFFGII